MAINLELEKSLSLTSQDVYDILDFSTQAAYDDGFMNSYIFERAIYIFSAIRLYPDKAEEITPLAAQNINLTWNYLLENGIVEDMISNYEAECNYLSEYGKQWFEDYTKYALSARGLLNNIQSFTGDLVNQAANKFKEFNDGSEIQEVLEIADQWGMNNAPVMKVNSESLFQE